MKTNILVQYSGGGYDGCIWEWNFFYIDEHSAFHNIISSGCSGINNLPDAEQLIIDDKDTTFVYDMNNKQNIELFSAENHAWNVQRIYQWFEDYNSPCAEFFAVCSECGNKAYDDMVIEGQEIMCYECYSIGQCPCCEYYVGGDDIIEVNPNEHHDHTWICTDCKEDHDNERETESLEDLRWQSFCTGKPDMFSGELREQRMSTGGGM